MLQPVLALIRHQRLVPSGSHVLVGVSGGADSVALAVILHRLAPVLKIRLTLAHIRHGIRGPSALEDARFVRGLARGLGLPFVTRSIDVPALAKQDSVSLEMAGRKARYRAFAQLARQRHCDRVAVAHTADDQAETVLLKLARGAGPQGLAGIPMQGEQAGLTVVRPLLATSRCEIEAFLKAKGQRWRDDETNADPRFLRNRVRHEILPVLEARLNPNVRQTWVRMADVMRAEWEWTESLIEPVYSACVEPGLAEHEGSRNGTRPRSRRPGRLPDDSGAALAPVLMAEACLHQPVAVQRRVIRRWIVAAGYPAERLDFDGVEQVMNLLARRRSGQRGVALEMGWRVTRLGPYLRLDGEADPMPTAWQVNVSVSGCTDLAPAALAVIAVMKPGIVRQRQSLDQYPASASLSWRPGCRARLVARSWKPGDRMRPWGMAGSKKVQDIFADAKVPAARRSQIPIFECQGEIVWIPGFRVARDWAVADETAPVLQLTVMHDSAASAPAGADSDMPGLRGSPRHTGGHNG